MFKKIIPGIKLHKILRDCIMIAVTVLIFITGEKIKNGY